MNQQKKEPWRIVVFIFAVGYIVYMWVEKDILAIYANLPAEQALPLAITTVAVSLFKVAILAIGIFVVKWIVNKIQK